MTTIPPATERAPAPAAADRVWTAAEAAEDLFAQIEDALRAGARDAELVVAAVAEGLEAETAGWLVADARADARAAGAAVADDAGAPVDARVVDAGAAGAGAAVDEAAIPAFPLELWQLRRALRDPFDPMRLPEARAQALVEALIGAGARPATAAAVIDELRRTERRMHEGFRARWRRLGLQGMVVGAAATALMLYGGSAGGAARWHYLTAALTAALFGYSALLWRRGRPPERR